jgi:uncharacterized protein
VSIVGIAGNGDSPFHLGEQAVQERTGVRVVSERNGRATITEHVPIQHRELFCKLPYLMVGTVDITGAAHATMLCGLPGFVACPDSKTIVVDVVVPSCDPVLGGLQHNASIGLLGIELSSRRRNRANGVISRVAQNGFAVTVNESFGNCPQYIASRSPDASWATTNHGQPLMHNKEYCRLSAAAIALIETCDTFFITSYVEVASAGRRVDVSHRGGRPGFVQVQNGTATTLTIPDFSGNRFFMTLGNLELNPRCGLAFMDFRNGHMLSLTGRADIVWSGDQLDSFVGAERLLRFTIENGVFLKNAIPGSWSLPEPAKQTGRTGSW